MAAPKIQFVEDGYRAGACNIGPAEIARRRTLGIVGLVGTAVIAVALVAAGAPAAVRFLVFFPLAGSLVSLEQARRRFCANYGLRGTFNFVGVGTFNPVANAADRAADRAASLRLIATTTGAAAVVAVVFALLPF